MKKILPDLTATELTGAGRAPLIPVQPISVDEIALTATTYIERYKARKEAPRIEAAPENEHAVRLQEPRSRTGWHVASILAVGWPGNSACRCKLPVRAYLSR
jgi:hypothetical protein